MFKTGIYHLDQIKKGYRLTDFFGQDKKLSITLYNAIQQELNAEELTERILFSFSDERGAYKRTYANRFEEFDQMVLSYLENTFKNEDPLLIHDVGVSDGRTSLDFFKKISSAFSKIKFVASDYNPKVYVLEKGRCKITISDTGKILEILFPPFVFNMLKPDARRYYPLNSLILLIVQRFFAVPLMKDYKAGKLQAKELMLFTPKLLKTAEKNLDLVLEQHNLLEPFKGKYHIVRAMNVLNLSYFSNLEFTKILSHIYSGLYENGFFITGSNEGVGTIVHGGIYKKTVKGFETIWNSGDGSHIEKLILGFNELK